MSQSYIAPVELEKAYRLLNHGPTVLVSAQHGDDRNVMAAAWACALEFKPAKVSVVLDKALKPDSLSSKVVISHYKFLAMHSSI